MGGEKKLQTLCYACMRYLGGRFGISAAERRKFSGISNVLNRHVHETMSLLQRWASGNL